MVCLFHKMCLLTINFACCPSLSRSPCHSLPFPLTTPLYLTYSKEITWLWNHSPDGISITRTPILQVLNGTTGTKWYYRWYYHHQHHDSNLWCSYSIGGGDNDDQLTMSMSITVLLFISYVAFVMSNFSSAARCRTTRDLEDGMLSFSASSSAVKLWSTRTAPCIPEFFRFPAYSYNP